MKLASVSIAIILIVNQSVHAQFSSERMRWFSQPNQWKVEGTKLLVTADPKTDFWQKTFYGYRPDNGHFYFAEYSGDFEAIVQVTGSFREQYDQAGLMIRIDSKNWIKSGVEFVDNKIHVSAVFTRDFSDWSVIAPTDAADAVWLKLVRKGDSVELSYSTDGKSYRMQRLGYFPPKVKAMIGIMAAAPEGKGFTVGFDKFAVKKL